MVFTTVLIVALAVIAVPTVPVEAQANQTPCMQAIVASLLAWPNTTTTMTTPEKAVAGTVSAASYFGGEKAAAQYNLRTVTLFQQYSVGNPARFTNDQKLNIIDLTKKAAVICDTTPMPAYFMQLIGPATLHEGECLQNQKMAMQGYQLYMACVQSAYL